MIKYLLVLTLGVGAWTAHLNAAVDIQVFQEKPAKSKALKFPALGKDKHLYGPVVTAEDLKGKVVFYECWGINCPPCRESFPHLVDLQSRYAKDGKFTVLASHSQPKTAELIPFLRQSRANFPVYQSIDPQGMPPYRGIPFAVLIDGNGTIIASGHPMELFSKVPSAIKQIKPPSIVEGVELVKYKSLAKSLTVNSKNVEGKIATLRSADNPEATAICEAYDAWIAARKAEIDAFKTTHVLAFMDAVEKLKAVAPKITDYDEALAEFKSNPKVKSLLAIQKKITAIQSGLFSGKTYKSKDFDSISTLLEPLNADEDAAIKATADALSTQLDKMKT